jgi:alkanesulfonate monooxygenase SsuD/methylene tetrahydromethanopterin reductase-like flavin-dependent oxidoreductase (luciferase family)
MRYGIVIPKGDPHAVAGLAREAEDNGWDGAFYWDGLFISGPDGVPWPVYDPWVVMAAMAMRTERVRIGAFVTPLSRRRPWKVAREALTLDHLSGGRLTLAVGLGAVDDGGFSRVGEATERKARAERLDESLAIMEGLWQGQPFAFSGKHFQLQEVTCLPRPQQRPRIPIWVVTAWPRPASLRRAMRWDGAIPAKRSPEGVFSAPLAPEDLRALREYAGQHRPPEAPFEVVLEGVTPGDDPPAARALVEPLAEAGATWWVESIWEGPNEVEDIRRRLRQGPPGPPQAQGNATVGRLA